MEKLVFLLILVTLSTLACQIIPITNQTDQNDIFSMVTLMEKTITTLQSHMTASNTELASVKSQQLSTESELSSVKAALQSQLLTADTELTTLKSRLNKTESKLTTVQSTLQSTESELSSMKSKQQTTETELTTIQSKLQTTEYALTTMQSTLQTTEYALTTVTSQLASAHAEIDVLKKHIDKTQDPNDCTQMKADLAVLRAQYTTLTSQFNATVFDRIGADLSSNTNNIQFLNASFISLHYSIGNINASTKYNAGDIAGLTSELTKVKSLNFDVNSTKSLCQKTLSDIKSLNSNISEMYGKVSTIQNSLLNITGSRISFDVRLMQYVVRYDKTLKFDDVTLNSGNAYNPQTGIFLAPVDGTYLFWANVMRSSSGFFDIYLMKEGRQIASGYTGKEISYGTATIIHVVQLKKGEHAWFTVSGSTSKSEVYGNDQSSYGGTLLYV